MESSQDSRQSFHSKSLDLFNISIRNHMQTSRFSGFFFSFFFPMQSLGGCNRCQMVNISNEAGQVKKSNEPLTTLASYRRVKVQHSETILFP